MGWALLPTTWFTNEYKRHLDDLHTYKHINDFNKERHIADSNKLLTAFRSRFDILLPTNNKSLLNPLLPTNVQLPFMKLLPKVHKLSSPASPDNLNQLTGRPIITAHSWTTSNVSKLLGTELDSVILQLKNLFISQNKPFPLIYNSSELVDILQKHHIADINNFKLTTFDFSSLYTNITFQDTINAIIKSCKLLKLSTFYRDFLLNLNDFINNRNFFTIGNDIYQQTQGIAMVSYHSRQMADLVLLLSEFNFYNSTDILGLYFLSRYIDDGFLLTNETNNDAIIDKLISFYPRQIPITFTSNPHNVHYLDLSISLNHHSILFNKIHYQIYQKPNHKYMYPHYSSNHPHHIFNGLVKTETI